MKLTDLQPLAKWVELEEAIHLRSGMRASIYDIDGNLDIALVIGSEGKGIRHLVKKKCDF